MRLALVLLDLDAYDDDVFQDGWVRVIAENDEDLNIVDSALMYYRSNRMGSQSRPEAVRERRWANAYGMARAMEEIDGFPTFYKSPEEVSI